MNDDAEMLRILREMDQVAARNLLPNLHPYSVLVGMHKARLHKLELTDTERQLSLDWLREKGFKDIGGAPLPNFLPR